MLDCLYAAYVAILSFIFFRFLFLFLSVNSSLILRYLSHKMSQFIIQIVRTRNVISLPPVYKLWNMMRIPTVYPIILFI